MSSVKQLSESMVAAVKAYVGRAFTPLEARINTAEARMGALLVVLGKGAGAAETISAFEAIDARLRALEGMRDVAGAIARLEATMAAPVTPIYDERGKLIGASRSTTRAQ